jgi:hypothetical protein
MKKITLIISGGALLLSIVFANPLNAQDAQKEVVKSKQIPADVTSIIERSCVGCHSEDGNTFAKMHFNFTKWNEYSMDEQASIGKDICTQLTKGKMPPKKFLESKPDAKPSDEEKTTVCNWASQLETGK